MCARARKPSSFSSNSQSGSSNDSGMRARGMGVRDTFQLRTAAKFHTRLTYFLVGVQRVIEVVNMNDWLVVEPNDISTFATSSVPALTWMDVGFPSRSEQHGCTPTVSTSRSG